MSSLRNTTLVLLGACLAVQSFVAADEHADEFNIDEYLGEEEDDDVNMKSILEGKTKAEKGSVISFDEESFNDAHEMSGLADLPLMGMMGASNDSHG